MFKQRLLSALVLIPLVLSLILYGPAWLLAALLCVLLSGAAYEWMRLIPLERAISRFIYVLVLLAAAYLSWRYQEAWLWLGVMLWVGLMGCIVTYPRSVKLWGHRLIVGAFSAILLPLSYFGLSHIYETRHGSFLVIYLLCLVWAADTGGYLVGRKWGQRRVIPNVSPGKTVAGVLGGAICVFIVSGCAALYFKPKALFLWLGVAGLIFLSAFFGDLFVSMMKRRVQLKDTGALIPGHGGLLDRIDSLLAAIPVFAFCLYLLPELVS